MEVGRRSQQQNWPHSTAAVQFPNLDLVMTRKAGDMQDPVELCTRRIDELVAVLAIFGDRLIDVCVTTIAA